MSGVENMNLSPRVIAVISFGAGDSKGSVVPTPKHEQWRLMIPQPLLPFWIRFDIVLIVVKQVQLNIRLSRLVEEVIFIDPEVGVVERDVRRGSYVPFLGCLE